MALLKVVAPYSGEVLQELNFASPSEVTQTLDRSLAAFESWKLSSAWDRSQLLEHAASQLFNERQAFAELICQEVGKPIQLAVSEVDRAIDVLRWAAAEAQRFSGELLRLDTRPLGRSGFGIHTRFPKGVILGITPYNFPLNLVIHKIAPALASGCSIVIKPSPFAPLTAIRLAQLFQSAIPNLVQVLICDDSTTAQLTQARAVSMISFTGSARIGWMIRQQAPAKPTTLELGGNAWVIVLEDTPAELFPKIAKRICGAGYGYAGQSCIAVQNIAVAQPLWPEFQKHLISATQATLYGDPALASVISGPLIHAGAAEKTKAQLLQLPEGTQVYTSQNEAGVQKGKPSMIPPTLVLFPSDKNRQAHAPAHALMQEEVFAPVMTAQAFDELPEVIRAINSSRYGLQTGAYTQNWSVIEQLYRELDVGGLVVNDVPTTRYDHQPYGGVKDSGQGREGIKYAMEEMTDSKFLALSSQVL